MERALNNAEHSLAELERGLQSTNVGEQSEAIVRFTGLLNGYPLPSLINSACLKLAEAFRCGTNFIRMQICEVFERNKTHLSKIYTVDDFYRNIFTVTTSNDPLARSITLLTLGNIAPVVSEYKSIHHCITGALESKYDCELNAAIISAASYVKYSSEFAGHIYPKMVSIIDSSETTTEVLLKALSVLDHGFYNANDALMVRSFLIDVMGRIKLKKVVCVCLTLSTRITFTSLSHIHSQIELLIKIFLDNSKLSIKYNALRNLKFLAEKIPHIWQTSHIDPLVSYLERVITNRSCDSDDQCCYATLSIFCELLKCKCNFISQSEKDRIFKQCHKLAFSKTNLSLCSISFELMTIMFEEQSYSTSSNLVECQSNDLVSDITAAIKVFLSDSPAPKQTRSSRRQVNSTQPAMNGVNQVKTTNPSPKAVYRHIVKLCKLNLKFCPELLKLLIQRISSKDTSLEDLSSHVTELMCAITQSTMEQNVNPDLYWKLIKTRSHEMSEANLLNICVLYFQTLRLNPSHSATCDLAEKVIEDHSLWFGFKVLRQAMRYGHHKTAKLICDEINERVVTDITDFYFKSLGKICQAESMLNDKENLRNNLPRAILIYEESVSPLRASVGDSQTTNFQLRYLNLRIKCLQIHKSLRQCFKIYYASPISYATLLTAIGATRGTSDPGLSRLTIIQQMPKIAKEFRAVADEYEDLIRTSFNCDKPTLQYVHLLKYSCLIMADSIDAIFQYGRNFPIITKMPFGDVMKSELEHREFEQKCHKLIELIDRDILKPGIFPSSSAIDPLIELLEKLSDEILTCSFVYPRYFFQPLQKTQIKLAITPSSGSNATPLYVNLNNHFVLKVEGLIQDSSKPYAIVRKISKIIASVTMNPAKATEHDSSLFFQSISTPENNYFKSEFLLPLRWSGLFNIDVNISIMDDQDNIWKYGVKERITINVSR